MSADVEVNGSGASESPWDMWPPFFFLDTTAETDVGCRPLGDHDDGIEPYLRMGVCLMGMALSQMLTVAKPLPGQSGWWSHASSRPLARMRRRAG